MMDSQSNFPGQSKIIVYSRIIDLSHVIDRDIPVWPGDPAVEFQTVARLSKDGYYLRRFSMGEHSETHMNAPKSFHTRGEGIDAYSAESLVVTASVIDVSEKAAGNADYALSVEDVWSGRDDIVVSMRALWCFSTQAGQGNGPTLLRTLIRMPPGVCISQVSAPT